MSFTDREFWGLLHGLLIGGLFLVSYTGGLVGLLSLQSASLTAEGVARQTKLVQLWTTAMAVVIWCAVLIGTYIVYPWYRAKAPAGADLSAFPQKFLMADPLKSGWHNFGMEWKEHIGWFAPILATTTAYLVWRFGSDLVRPDLRRLCIGLLTAAFLTAILAGLLGALITKAAPLR